MRKLWIIGLVLAAVALIIVVIVGDVLSAPRQGLVGQPPFGAETISIPRDDASPISGWLIRGCLQKAGVLLLHSIRSNRREMIGRAKFLSNAGYTILLIDMQAHGETLGQRISFGYLESRDAHRALDYLRSYLPGQPIGVIGVSLGGAAILLGDKPVPADAFILEGVYSSIDRAVENRLAIYLGEWGRYLAPLLLWQLEPRLGISADMLAPVIAVSQLEAPVMIISGSQDRRTELDETQRLFLNAPEPKVLWMVKGAKHQDLHHFAPQEYERKVLEFFGKNLKPAI